MALPNYPNNPQVNDTFLVGNKTFQWDGEKWKALSNADNSLRTQLADVDSDVLVGGVEAGNLSTLVVDARDFGAVGDGVTDDTSAIQQALNSGENVLLPEGDIKITSTLNVPIGTTLLGRSAEKTKIISYVQGGILLHINENAVGGNEYNRLQDLTLLSSFGRDSLTDEIAIQHGTTYSVVFAEYNNIVIDGFSKAGLYNTRGWHTVFNLVYFIRCGNKATQRDYYGGIIFDQRNSGTPNWAGSTFQINNTTFISCEYGVYNDGAWNVTIDNCVFEDINTPFYKAAQGSTMIVRNCWFEDAENQPVIEGKVQIENGRAPKTGGQNPSSGVDFDGINGGEVLFIDNADLYHYSNNSGVPESEIKLTTRSFVLEFLRSKTELVLENGSGDKVVLDNTGGDFRPSGTDAQQALGGVSNRWSESYVKTYRVGNGTAIWTSGAGSPEGNITGAPGSLYSRLDGGAGTSLYIKESGSGNTGWVAK